MAQSDAILARLGKLHPKVIDLSLGRITRLLEKLGNPHLSLPPVIHIAGTNGKGSTLAYLRAIYEAAGLRVHCSTSPHLVRFHERITLAGQMISEDALCDLLTEVETVNNGESITFFEITQAAAFLAFARVPADVLLLETGLGGRVDASNVIDTPAATVITPISLDHQGFLGDTIAKIAFEKAGIMKPGIPCITAPQSLEAFNTLACQANRVSAPVFSDFEVIEEHEDGFVLRVGSDQITLPLPALPVAINLPTPPLLLRRYARQIFRALMARTHKSLPWPCQCPLASTFAETCDRTAMRYPARRVRTDFGWRP